MYQGQIASEVAASHGALEGSIYDRLDMLPLDIADGKTLSEKFTNAANTTETLDLPDSYDSANNLFVMLITKADLTLEVTSPEFSGGKSVVVRGNSTHPGIFVWQGRVTSLETTVPTGATAAEIEVFMYEIPTLNDSDSYSDGPIALGYY